MVGLDAAIWIYEFEANSTYGPIVHPFFRDRLDAGKNRFGSSLLTLAEVLVQPSPRPKGFGRSLKGGFLAAFGV